MALKNKKLSEPKQVISKSEKQGIIKKIEKKLEQAEDIYFGELALSRINETKFTSKQVREEFGI